MKAGEKIHVATFSKDKKPKVIIREIVGFLAYGVMLKYNDRIRTFHFNNGLFYGFGYYVDTQIIYTYKKWHIIPARICEYIRRKLPAKLAIKLNLEDR